MIRHNWSSMLKASPTFIIFLSFSKLEWVCLHNISSCSLLLLLDPPFLPLPTVYTRRSTFFRFESLKGIKPSVVWFPIGSRRKIFKIKNKSIKVLKISGQRPLEHYATCINRWLKDRKHSHFVSILMSRSRMNHRQEKRKDHWL